MEELYKKLKEEYNFDDEVISELLEYCKSKGHMEQDYISRVAESWYKNNIITNQDLENYYKQYESLGNLKMKAEECINREITQFEEAYLEKWIMNYKLSDNEIISVLKNATDKNFDKLDKELTKTYEQYTYNSNLDINETIEIEMELKEDVIKELRIERVNNGRKEVIPLKFLVPSIIKNNQVIVIEGEGNKSKNERGNINIKVVIK